MGSSQQILAAEKAAAVGGGSDSGPELITGLQLWLNANALALSDGAQVTTWADTSGNGRDATGVLGNTHKPLYRATGGPNSKPAVQMVEDVSDQGGWFTLPDFLTALAATSGHAFSVVKIDHDPPGSTLAYAAPPLGDWGTTNDEYYTFDNDGVIYDSWGANARKTTSNPTTSLTTWHVYEQRTASGAWSRRINAATSGNDFFSTASNTVAWSTAPKIARSTTNGKFMHGLIAEVIFYNSILGSTDYASIKTYLNTKYGFSL